MGLIAMLLRIMLAQEEQRNGMVALLCPLKRDPGHHSEKGPLADLRVQVNSRMRVQFLSGSGLFEEFDHLYDVLCVLALT